MDLIDYKTYRLSLKEYFIYGILALFVLMIFSYLFYNSFIPIMIFLPLSKPYYRIVKNYLCNKRKDKLCQQFNDAMQAISAALETGSSFENAIWEAFLEVSAIYSKNSYMSVELYAIYNQLKLSVPIEEAFSSLSNRTDVSDIITFIEIINIAKRTDGNLLSVIRYSSATINEKLRIKREIRKNINGKKFEQMIMTLMPLLIVIYIQFTSPGFFDCLYHNIAGIIFVTLCLFIYCLSVFLAVRITNIEF